MVIKLIAAAVLLVFNSEHSPVWRLLHLSTIPGKKGLSTISQWQHAATLLSLKGGWPRVGGIQSTDTGRRGGDEPATNLCSSHALLAEQETSDLFLLCFSRCCSPAGEWNTLVAALFQAFPQQSAKGGGAEAMWARCTWGTMKTRHLLQPRHAQVITRAVPLLLVYIQLKNVALPVEKLPQKWVKKRRHLRMNLSLPAKKNK